MTPEHADAPGPRGAQRLWRVGTPVMVLLCGGLFVVSATSSEGTDLRPGRYTDLASLVQKESDDYQSLQSEAGDLKEEVDALTGSVDDDRVRKARRQAEALKDPAGLEPVSGTGVSVVLSDASEDKLESVLADPDPENKVERYIVHQQDIQAVVNAMWAGGASAVTIQGQRIVSTTGIKCSASAVQLQGVPYAQPYTIQAVGDIGDILEAIEANEDVDRFRSDADNPDIGVGWALDTEDVVEAPAYDGLLDITYAEPVGSA